MFPNSRRWAAIFLVVSLALPISVTPSVKSSAAAGELAVQPGDPNTFASIGFHEEMISPVGDAQVELVVDASSTYSISGSVTDEAGNPLAAVTVTATRADIKYPIIFLPGMMGSRLEARVPEQEECNQRASGIVWLNFEYLSDPTLQRESLNTLYLNDYGDDSANPCDKGRIAPADLIDDSAPVKWFRDIYKDFVQSLEGAGYTVHTFPYDWRLDIDRTAEELDRFIEDKVGASGQVTLIGHSMGGLVVRAYIGEQNRAFRVHKVITIGTPYLGTPLAAYVMLTGAADIMPSYLRPVFEPSKTYIKEIVRNSLGAMQLVPSRAYHDYGPYYVSDSTLLETYESTMNYFIGKGQNAELLNAAQSSFHDRYDDFSNNYYLTGEYYILAARHMPTTSAIRENRCMWHFGRCYRTDKYLLGDGTVPDVSSRLRAGDKNRRGSAQVCVYNQGQVSEEHYQLMTDSNIRTDIFRLLQGEEPQHCELEGKASAQALLTPERFREIGVWGDVQVRVEDSAGNYVGVDEDGFLNVDLPDVTYQFVEGGIIVTLPLGTNYRLIIEHSGKILPQVTAADFGAPDPESSFTAQEQAIFVNIPAGEEKVVIIENSGGLLSELQVGLADDPNGELAEMFAPDAILTNPESVQDYTMPSTALAVGGTQDSTGAYIGPVTVTLTTQDSGSGVLRSYVSIDGGQVWQEYITLVQIAQGQATSIQAYSIDRAGNWEWPLVAQSIAFTDEVTDTPTVTPTSIPTETQVPTATATSIPTAEPTPTPAPTYPSVDTTHSHIYLPVVIRKNQQVSSVTNVHESVLVSITNGNVYSASTDADGHYTLDNLPPGTYTVVATHTGVQLSPIQRTAILPPSAEDIDFTGSAFNRPPNAPQSPSPSEYADNQNLDISLSWSGGDPDGDFVTYDVYFGKDSLPDTPIAEGMDTTSFDPGQLKYGAVYVWRVVATDSNGVTTLGPIWEFYTRPEVLLGPPINITNHPASDGGPVWSPDGNRIVFQSSRDTIDGLSELYVMDDDGSHVNRVTYHEPEINCSFVGQGTWSPDGSKIRYMANDDSCSTADIYLVNVDGTNPTKLTDLEYAIDSPTWSPDGSKIVFSSNRDSVSPWSYASQLYVMNSDITNISRLTDVGYWNDALPTWSPDGSKIVFRRSSGSSDSGLFVMDADGDNLTRFTEPSYYVGLFSMSPDGNKIIFSAQKSFTPFAVRAYVMDATSSSQPEMITDFPLYSGSPLVWSPDSRKILLTKETPGVASGTLMMINVDGSDPLEIIGSFPNSPSWSPDGKMIVFSRSVASPNNQDIFSMTVNYE